MMTTTIKRELSNESIAWSLSQLVEDYAAAIMPLTIDRTMHEAYVSPEHLTAALLSPVSFGAVIADVAEALGVAIPWSVRRAVGDDLTPDAA